jgi:hypothetical protein
MNQSTNEGWRRDSVEGRTTEDYVGKMAALNSGGAKAILEAMRTRSQVVNLQEAGCSTLCDLASQGATEKDSIITSGALDIVTSAMQTHATDPGLQQAACRILTMLADSPESVSEIIKAGGALQ